MKVNTHEHPLNLIDLWYEDSDYEDEYDEDGEEIVDTKVDFKCQCDRCAQEINWFHRYYYKCHQCKYSLHKYCQELPTTLEEHTSHLVSHTFHLVHRESSWMCNLCRSDLESQDLCYQCSQCSFDIDVNCALNRLHNNIIYHPSHPHPLVRISKQFSCKCDACGIEHRGVFYRSTVCPSLFIHTDCFFLSKLSIQRTTNGLFSHSHLLTLNYSFPKSYQNAKFNPRCRVCDDSYFKENLWIFKCEKCRYYVHLACATARGERFMSIVSSRGETPQDFSYLLEDHPNLISLPFADESYNILKHLFYTLTDCFKSQPSFRHQHPLVLVDTRCNDITKPTSSRICIPSCHNPMKRAELLCNVCVRPITDTPFYKCVEDDCNFVLHEWCARMPSEIGYHPLHPMHRLVFLPIHYKFLGVSKCVLCDLPCNGFVYSCSYCDFTFDMTCGFAPAVIKHKAHPNHRLHRVLEGSFNGYCHMCLGNFRGKSEEQPKNYRWRLAYRCGTCDFQLHYECALLLPETIRNKIDKHPLKLSYKPIENHKSEYFCEICEEEFDPERCFYHCGECHNSVHSACAPLIVDYAKYTYSHYRRAVYQFINVKFGGTHKINHHPHPLTFLQGVESDGLCTICHLKLQYKMILKCQQCEFSVDYKCGFRLHYHGIDVEEDLTDDDDDDDIDVVE